jgi:hypothetical protein
MGIPAGFLARAGNLEQLERLNPPWLFVMHYLLRASLMYELTAVGRERGSKATNPTSGSLIQGAVNAVNGIYAS